MCLSPFILQEVAGALARRFDWDGERQAQVARALVVAATVIEPRGIPETIEGGHADNRILECVAEAPAGYLVTGGICCPSKSI